MNSCSSNISLNSSIFFSTTLAGISQIAPKNLKYHYLNKKIVEVKMKEQVNLDDEDGIVILKDKGYNLKIEVDTTKRDISDVINLFGSL